MTRGQAQQHVPPAEVIVFPDGGSYLASQTYTEARHALAEAESAARVDEYRRAFDEAVENHMARFGFDRNGDFL